MATAAKKDQTPEDATEATSDKSHPPTEVDVVALPSLRADGTPDQTPGFVTIGDDADKSED